MSELILKVIYIYFITTIIITISQVKCQESDVPANLMRKVVRDGGPPRPAEAPDFEEGKEDYMDYMNMFDELMQQQQPSTTTPAPITTKKRINPQIQELINQMRIQGILHEDQHQDERNPYHNDHSLQALDATVQDMGQASQENEARVVAVGQTRRGKQLFARYKLEVPVEVPLGYGRHQLRQRNKPNFRVIRRPLPPKQLLQQQQQQQQPQQRQQQQQQRVASPAGPVAQPSKEHLQQSEQDQPQPAAPDTQQPSDVILSYGGATDDGEVAQVWDQDPQASGERVDAVREQQAAIRREEERERYRQHQVRQQQARQQVRAARQHYPRELPSIQRTKEEMQRPMFAVEADPSKSSVPAHQVQGPHEVEYANEREQQALIKKLNEKSSDGTKYEILSEDQAKRVGYGTVTASGANSLSSSGSYSSAPVAPSSTIVSSSQTTGGGGSAPMMQMTNPNYMMQPSSSMQMMPMQMGGMGGGGQQMMMSPMGMGSSGMGMGGMGMSNGMMAMPQMQMGGMNGMPMDGGMGGMSMGNGMMGGGMGMMSNPMSGLAQMTQPMVMGKRRRRR